ncbi:protein translocase component YidC [Synergistales bacterium]|nr:protein translocase component YidC [Synergistales bacterium]
MFGAIWDAGVLFLQSILEFFRGFSGSYGIAIILLTIIVRLLLYPLSQKQLVSMTQMQKLQPRLKVLQTKYENDKERLQQEVMRLYKENNVNPLAGCFPLLVQLPIMILLYQSLYKLNYEIGSSLFLGISLEKSVLDGLAKAVSIVHESGVPVGFLEVFSGITANPGGLLNFGLYLPSLIITAAVIFLTWFQQKISGAANNPQMATMTVIMPIFMGFICLSLPGGVLVYWATSSVIGLAQQWFALRRTKVEMEIKPVLHKNKPVSGGQPQQGGGKNAKADEYEDEYEDDDEYEDEEDYEDDEDDSEAKRK